MGRLLLLKVGESQYCVILCTFPSNPLLSPCGINVARLREAFGECQHEKHRRQTAGPDTALALLIALSGCARGPANSNSNLTANVNVNVNANASTGANINASTAPSVIAAREPDTYRATLVFAAETEGGDKAIGIPQLSAKLQRAETTGDSPSSYHGSDLVYLEKAGVQYGIAPGRKQYAELTPEATGFQLQRLMTRVNWYNTSNDFAASNSSAKNHSRAAQR